MYALTAAHKTLPFSTYIRVKNLDNGRVAIVKVNDRGPFYPGRIIDLSYRAAIQLGLLPKGTAHVQIEAIKTFSHPTHATAVGKYYIQAASFAKFRSAQQFRRMILTHSSRPVFIVHQDKKFQVRIGPFLDKKQVNKAEALLLKRGIKGGFTIVI